MIFPNQKCIFLKLESTFKQQKIGKIKLRDVNAQRQENSSFVLLHLKKYKAVVAWEREKSQDWEIWSTLGQGAQI